MSNATRRHALIRQGVQWLILDAAACPEPLWFARGAGLNSLSLFRQQDEDLADSGPWLIAIDKESGVIDVCLRSEERRVGKEGRARDELQDGRRQWRNMSS